MTKIEFLKALEKRFQNLPPEEREERIAFYREMIDDRMEEGLSEAEAVAAVAPMEEREELEEAETPTVTKPGRTWKAWEILCLVLGSPIWLSLLIAAAAVVFSLIVSVWAIFVALIGTCVGSMVSGIAYAVGGYGLSGTAMIAAGLICGGLSVFALYGCKAVTKGTWFLGRKLFTGKGNG